MDDAGSTALDLRAALAACDLGDVLDLSPLPGEHANQPHIVTAGAGRFLAKVLSPRLSAPPTVQLRHAFVAHLASRGVRVPQFVTTRNGDPVVHAKGRAIEVQKFIGGSTLRGDDPADALLAGEALAAVHRAGADFTPPQGAAARDALSFQEDLRGLDRLEQQMQTYLPAPEVLQSVEAVRRALLSSARELANADLPVGVVHGDFGPESLVRDKEGLVWVTDFDACGWAPLLLDVADLIRAFGRGALAAYEQRRPLTEAERALAPTASRMASIHRELARGTGVEMIAQRLACEASL